MDLNERLLAAMGLTWQSVSLIEDSQWQTRRVQDLAAEAATYLKAHFMSRTLWGFKDPRTVRLLPFWRAVFQHVGVDDRYVIAIRNPLSVASSLRKRDGLSTATSHMLWLLYVVPFLHEIAEKPFVVTDYDLLLANPREQLARIGRALKIPHRQTNDADLVALCSQEAHCGSRAATRLLRPA